MVDAVLNTFVNTLVEMKNLRLYVPNMGGKFKCHKMHVGGKLKVRGSVKDDMYLGDLISSEGKNMKNVGKRTSKGIITQIMNLFENESYGKHCSLGNLCL